MVSNVLYDSYLIEIRPRLQSVNAFFRIKSSIDVSTCKAKFENNKLYITHGLQQEVIALTLNIKHNSFNYTHVKNNFLCFRFCTNVTDNSPNGSFRAEMLNLHNEGTTDVDISKMLTPNSFLEADQHYALKCKSCKSTFCNSISFKRILPLPTDSSDSSDWFCHQHENVERDGYSKSQAITDLLHSDAYVHIHKTILGNYSREDNNINCRICSIEVGNNLIKTDNICKCWKHKLIFENLENGEMVTSDPLLDIFKIIVNLSKDPLRRTIRLVINTSVDGIDEYILLWIMEKSLKVLLSPAKAEDEYVLVAKVLYSHSQEENDLVKEWLDNTEVFTVNVSNEMLLALKDHLIQMCSYMPPEFIKSQHLNVSFLNMY